MGGARHHLFWSVARPDDLSTFVTDEFQLVRLRGVVISQPWIRQADQADWRTAVPQIDRSHCVVESQSLATSGGWVSVSGRLWLTVDGHLLHVETGDDVEVLGWLSIPRLPGNPGQYDFHDHLRRQNCRCLLYANHPDVVRKLRDGGRHNPTRMLEQFRERAELLCLTHLSESNFAVASALLLGNRSLLTDETRAGFAESGTMHILAISGLHVGILAALLWCGCRFLNCSVLATAAVIIGGVAIYAIISGGRPPVLRASIFILISVVGNVFKRRTSAKNTLALSAIVVLAWNPSDLFDVGAQLSFLAVLGMILTHRPSTVEQPPVDSPQMATALTLAEPSRLTEWLRNLGDWLKRACWLMGGIWLLTLPLVMARFHLASPIGFIINVVLFPLVCLILWTGFVFLFCGMFIPYAAVPLGFAFDWELSGLQFIVDQAAHLHLGHLYVPGPPMWWIVFYYSLLAVTAWSSLRPGLVRIAWRALLVWVVVGLAIGMVPGQRNGLQCTVLDMGHGCAVLIELPNGKTLLYDVGTLTDASRAHWTVENAIWNHRLSRLDALVISHADIDHFNGAHDLLRTVPIGCVLVSQPFLDFEQRAVRELCDVVDQRQIPIRLLQAGDRLAMDNSALITILHPPGDRRFDSDNQNSIVLLIEYAGRRILLTGDLEREGLHELLVTQPCHVDILLAPHHGSKAANPPELAAWASPQWVVVSTREERNLPFLKQTYGSKCRVVSTAEYGAMTFTIHPDGSVNASATRKPFEHPPQSAGKSATVITCN
jgi:competence protein ComEC